MEGVPALLLLGVRVWLWLRGGPRVSFISMYSILSIGPRGEWPVFYTLGFLHGGSRGGGVGLFVVRYGSRGAHAGGKLG